MLNLEDRINHVWNPDVRPLVAEAYRCYSSGSPRAVIVLTWTAVCGDLIHKLYQLAEDGEGRAETVTKNIDGASEKGGGEAVKAMQAIESALLQTAMDLELIDFTEKELLDRLQRDRNLCAHPSLRPLGQLFTPTLDYARAHLATALEAVLTHPPSQGRKVIERFAHHVAAHDFVDSPQHVLLTFYDRVKPATRAKVVDLAAKHAVLELDVADRKAWQVADHHAACLRAFADRDRELAATAVAKAVGRLPSRPASVQLRALLRLGEFDLFVTPMGAAMWNHFETLLAARLPDATRPDALMTEEESALAALVAVDHLRARMPSLDTKFQNMNFLQASQTIVHRPTAPYFRPVVILVAANSPDPEDAVKNILLPIAPSLTESELRSLLGKNSSLKESPTAVRWLWSASGHHDSRVWEELVLDVSTRAPDRLQNFSLLVSSIARRDEAGRLAMEPLIELIREQMTEEPIMTTGFDTRADNADQ